MQENTLVGGVRQLDRLLRGEVTRLSALRRGVIEVAPDGLSLLILVMGLIYGCCMGSYALFQPGGASWPQFVATAGKVPLLFVLTLLVTFPSLYVFNALVGSRLGLGSAFRLIIASMSVMLAILASFGPIVAFFGASTTSYSFMLLLNVCIFAVSGALGLKFLLFTLHRLNIAQNGDTKEEAIERAGALDKLEDHAFGSNVTTIFRIWVIVFALVGAQMSWVLRPFLGAPDRGFMIFAPRESNFFQALFEHLMHLLGA